MKFIFVFSVLVFLLHYFVVGQAVYGDGRFYYSFAHSLYFDHDINLSNQLSHKWDPVNNNLSLPKNGIPEKTPSQSLGTGLFWIPALAFIDIFSNGNGYSDSYQIGLGLYSILFIVVGIFLVFKTLGNFVDRATAKKSLILMFFTTNLFYYGSIDVLNTHPISFFLNASFLYLVIYWKTVSDRRALMLGLLAGMVVSVREHDILTILPLLVLYPRIHNGKYQDYFKFRYLVWFFAGGIIAFSPQIIYWITNSKSFLSPRFALNQWNFASPKLIPILFDSHRGLLFYSPSLILAILFLFHKKQTIFLASIAAVLMQSLLISVWWAWHQGESYGIRMLISTYPLISIGYVELVKKIGKYFSVFLYY